MLNFHPLPHPQTLKIINVYWVSKPDSSDDFYKKVEAMPDEDLEKGLETLFSLGDWYSGLRRLAKRALCSCVDQTYQDMTDFLLGYSNAFSRKPKTFNVGNIGNPTFEIYLYLLVSWQGIARLSSVRQLHELLVKVFGAHQVGDQKRIEKICQRIGLSFRKAGRPKK